MTQLTPRGDAFTLKARFGWPISDGEGELMRRPNEREFIQEVLRDLKDLPEGLASRFAEVFDQKDVDRSEAIRKLFEDFARE